MARGSRIGARLWSVAAAAVLIGSAGLGATAAPVSAAPPPSLVAELTPAVVPAGATVSGRLTGENLALASPHRVDAYIAPAASDPASTRDPTAVPVGTADLDQRGNGTVTFTVPAVPAGPYKLILDCGTCGAAIGGREMVPVGRFVIEPAPARPPLGAALLVLVGAVVVVSVVARRLRPTRTR